jgi:hypothetical protein
MVPAAFMLKGAGNTSDNDVALPYNLLYLFGDIDDRLGLRAFDCQMSHHGRLILDLNPSSKEHTTLHTKGLF